MCQLKIWDSKGEKQICILESWQKFACVRKTWKSNGFIKCKFKFWHIKFIVWCESLETSWKRIWEKCKFRKVTNEKFDTDTYVGDIESDHGTPKKRKVKHQISNGSWIIFLWCGELKSSPLFFSRWLALSSI